MDTEMLTHEITGDGRTVWVTGPEGDCIARFGRYGIDIHRPNKEMLEGKPECLECTHSEVSLKDWERFKVAMIEYYNIIVDDEVRPTYLSLS